MSEPSSDPLDARMLFSPPNPSDGEPLTDPSNPADTPMSTDESPTTQQASTHAVFSHIELHALHPSQKVKYRSLADEDFHSDVEYEGADRIMGMAREGNMAYFYVRYSDGVIYKVSYHLVC